MLIFVLGIILFAVGVTTFILAKKVLKEQPKNTDAAAVKTVGIVVVVIAGLLMTSSFYRGSVGVGEVGIPVTLGKAGAARGSGPVFGLPWTSLKKLTIQTQEYTMTVTSSDGSSSGDDSIEVKGSDGATGWVDATILYRLVEGEAPRLYREVGTGYLDKIIRPTARTCIRDAFANFPMVDASTSKRTVVSDSIAECLRSDIEPRGFIIEEFQLRNVRVSDNVQQAIDAKVAAEQEAQRKNIELQSASAEAEKKRIEAKGVADSEQIIKCGATVETVTTDTGEVIEVATPKEGPSCENNLTSEYLMYQYIQALQSLVDSPNNSTIVIPTDSNLTPLLNTGKP
jgi:regulator of protease activity HflC (stomatin/prohibitin superfamily)